jgi:hypothetical protein
MKYPKLLTVHCPQDLTSASMGQSSCRYVSLHCDWPGQSAHITFHTAAVNRDSGNALELRTCRSVDIATSFRACVPGRVHCPFPKSIFVLTRVGARFMGGNLVSVSDPPFHIFSFYKVHVSRKLQSPTSAIGFFVSDHYP